MNGEKKIVDSPNAVSFKKKISFEEKEQNKHKIHCHKQSHMIESFDGGQTLRHDNQDEDQVDDVAYRPDKPVSINSSIEIISKKKSSREVMNMPSHMSPIEHSAIDKTKKKSKYMATRQNLNLNQITSLS